MEIFPIPENLLSKICTRLSNNYVTNVDYSHFLIRNNYQILLNQFICIMYGNTEENVRKIEFVQFLEAYFVSKSKISYHVYLHSFQQARWVMDTLSLRKRIFGFTDKTSLLRTCFLYDPITDEIYRLQELRYNLQILTGVPYEEKMYKSITDYFVYTEKKLSTKASSVGEASPLISIERKKQIYQKMVNRLEHFSKTFENGFN